jgi:SAM-dependent methyltransferase
MQHGQASIEDVKEKLRAAWTAGDFGQIAQYTVKAAEEFVDRLNIKAGDKVLDVACGTGNLAIPAARAGADVTGVDIAPNLLEQARHRAALEGWNIRFDEGDPEQLPFADTTFDLVMSSFGAMFAPRPERAAAELIRVCRPGGRIAMANWVPTSFVAKMFAVGARFVQPPEGLPSPILWGDEATARSRLANGALDIRTTRRKIDLSLPFGAAEVVQFFRKYFGPVNLAFSKLEPRAQTEYAAALESLWKEYNQGPPGQTLVSTEYLEVIATRA